MPFDDAGLSGEGSIKEYFTHEPLKMDSDLPIDPAFEKEINDRDSAIDRLCLELFTTLGGLNETETTTVFWPEEIEEVKILSKRKGVTLIGWQMDDPILAMFKDGKPIAAFYASYRGQYIAGGFVERTGQHLHATNLNETAEGARPDEWVEWESGCAQIAHDFLHFRRLY